MSPSGQATPEPEAVAMADILAVIAEHHEATLPEVQRGRLRQMAVYVGWVGQIPMRDVAAAVGLTEGQAVGIISDMRGEVHSRHFNDLSYFTRQMLQAARKRKRPG